MPQLYGTIYRIERDPGHHTFQIYDIYAGNREVGRTDAGKISLFERGSLIYDRKHAPT
jgi:hypothetical protein